MFEATYRILGLEQLLAVEKTFGAKTEGVLTTHLMRLGEHVAEDIRDVYVSYSVEGAYSIMPKVFTSGLWVVQTMPKSRRKNRQRENFGPKMFREAFLPAVDKNEDRIYLAADLAVQEARAMYWDRI